MPSTFCIVALIMLPAMARMAFTVEDDHRLLKEVATRGNRGNKIAPFMFRKIRDPSEEIGDRQTDKEQLQEHQQQQQSQSPGGIENMWSRNINRDRILNTVLAQMQQKDSRTPVSEIWNDNADYGDSDGIYTNDQDRDRDTAEYDENPKLNWDRSSRQMGKEKYYSICRTEKTIVHLNDPTYEYRPAHYEEIRCISDGYNDKSDKTACSKYGYQCMQWNETIHFTRKKVNSGCWESFTYSIPKGCECMWPEKTLGRMEHHQF